MHSRVVTEPVKIGCKQVTQQRGGGGGGGETTAPQCGTAGAERRTTAPREHQHETYVKSFKQENHCVDEAPRGQQTQSSAIRQNRTHKALILRVDGRRQEEAAHCEDSKVQTRRPFGPRFTSSLYFRFSSLQASEEPESGLERNSDSCRYSLTETQKPETENSGNKINGQTPSPRAFIKETNDSPLSETIQFPAEKKGDIITDDCNGLETLRNLATTHRFSDRQSRQYDCNGLHILQRGSQTKTFTQQVNLEEDHSNSVKQTDLEGQSDLTRTMLSSSVVTVLAPHWSGRLRRTKRFEGTGSLDAQGNLQDVTNTASKCAHEFLPENVDKLLTDGSQATVPFLGTRSNTVGWSTKSGPASLDYGSRRKMNQTFSLDSGRINSRNMHSGAVRTPESPVSPLSLEPNEQMRTQQTGHQGLISGSKPTTSSLLLSLRRLNSSGRTSSAASNLSEMNPSFLNSSPSDRDRKFFPTHLSQSFLNNNEQERSKPLLSPSSGSYRTSESGPSLSPSSSSHREKNIFETRFFSTSPLNKDTGDASFTQKPQIINRAQSTLLCSKQAFLSGEPNRDADKSSNLVSNSSVSSPTHSPYERSACLPRRTTLTSTSWWKKVTQEGSSPLTPSDTTNTKNKPNSPLVQPCDDNNDLASSSLTYNKKFSPIPVNRDNNNTSEPFFKGNMNLVMKTHSLKQSYPEDSPMHESDRLVKLQYGPNLNNRAPPKPHSLPDVLSGSKISRATAQTTLSHPKDLSRHDVSNNSFAANVSELPSLLLNPKSSQTPAESRNKYNNNHCTSKIDSSPTSPQNKDTPKLTKPFLSLVTTNDPNSQALSCTSAPGVPPAPNTKSGSSFQSVPVSSQGNSNTSSHTSSSSKFTNTANTTPLGFERSCVVIPKHLHSENVSSPVPTVSALSKTNYSPVSASLSSTAPVSHPASTTVSSSSLLTPHVTSAPASSPTAVTISSLLTPPATPIITSPKEEKLSSSQEKDTKKLGKRTRRVTWDDSVDLDRSESSKVEKPEPSPEPKSPSPPRSRSVKAPSIFSFLRSGSPTTNAYPMFSPTERTTSIQLGKGGKIRSLSSDSGGLISREGEQTKQRPSDMTFDQRRRDATTPRQERTLSVESGTVQYRSSAPLSLPADFSSGYKLRYSSPPYSTLKSSRSAQGETKTITPRSQLFQQPSQSNYTKPLSTHIDPVAAKTVPKSRLSLSPFSKPQPLSLSFSNKTDPQETSKCAVPEADQLDNDCGKNHQNGQILLLNNRVHISSQSLQGDKSSTCVTETLVYSLKLKGDTASGAPKDTTPKALKHTTNTPLSLEAKSGHHFDDSSSGSSSRDGQPPDDETCNRMIKDNVLAKSRFFSVESNNEQSPKRSRFALKKSVSTPSSSLSRSESERSSKTNKKMDQVINKLRQRFSTKRSDDDVSSLWKWKRASQTPSVSGSSDISNVSDSSAKAMEEKGREKGTVPKDNEKETWGTERWTQNRYTLTQPSAPGSTVVGEKFYNWPEKSTPETDQDEQNVSGQHTSESKNLPHLKIHSPTTQQSYKDNSPDYTPTNQLLSHRDLSPGRSPNPSAAYSTQFRKSPSSPRSPFSPFSSLSPLSPFPSPDVTDDSVFYSPKLQRRREASSPCEPVEGISLGGSRRSRASTGPPSLSPGQDQESSYADLKYGIEPGRSFSVSSVLSSRASRPGRISTGSRFMSVGDLSKSALACGGTDKDMSEWSDTPDWTTEYDCPNTKDSLMSYYSSEPGKMKSRSLPRSLTRRLANWSSTQPESTTTSKPTRLWTPMDTCHFGWDAEGPPTPPPTPPLSPVTRRISRPPSVSSPSFPSPSEKTQKVESQSPRGRLPSRGHVSSLSTFEESSDSSSDTTTDDEYYLETEDNDEKETEL